jgi:hypothetical protein
MRVMGIRIGGLSPNGESWKPAASRKLLKLLIFRIGLRFAFVRANFETEKFLTFETETAN